MKEALSHVTTAILLGILVMLIPTYIAKNFQPSNPTYYGFPSNGFDEVGSVPTTITEYKPSSPDGINAKASGGEKFDSAIMAQPKDFLNVGLMLLLTLFFALGLSIYIKKRVA